MVAVLQAEGRRFSFRHMQVPVRNDYALRHGDLAKGPPKSNSGGSGGVAAGANRRRDADVPAIGLGQLDLGGLPLRPQNPHLFQLPFGADHIKAFLTGILPRLAQLLFWRKLIVSPEQPVHVCAGQVNVAHGNAHRYLTAPLLQLRANRFRHNRRQLLLGDVVINQGSAPPLRLTEAPA